MKQFYSKRRMLTLTLCAILLCTFALTVFTPLPGGRPQIVHAGREQASNTKPRAAAKSSIIVSDSPAAAELGRGIDRAIDGSDFATAQWGVYVASLRDGRVLYARNADMPLTPASNMKVYTTAAALSLLGADYRWRTSVYAATQPDTHGTITGDLVLYGRGAPDLTSRAADGHAASLDQLADALYKGGVRRVSGAIVGDESYFRGEPLGEGWLWNDVQWYFGAEVSALNINGNALTLTINPSGKIGGPAGVQINPATDYVHLINDTNTAERGTPSTVGLNRGLSDNEVRVWGDFPVGGRGFNARLSVHRPAMWAATLFRDALKARGISVEGEARARDARLSREETFNPQRAVELASTTGKSLGEIVHATNKESLNLEAELLLRTLGKERGATAPDPDPHKMATRGDDQAGIAVMRQWMQQSNVPTGSLSLFDGSGLSRLDLVTAETTARLLALMARSASAQIFRDSLPVSGRDGTLASRLRAATGRINAKTGTLTHINSLSGYVTTADNETLVFSIICNNETSDDGSIGTIDSIAALLSSFHAQAP